MNKEAIENLNIPIILKYSFIDKFILKIPWSKLSTEPVEVIIENIFGILGPKSKENWHFMNNISYKYKIQII